MRVLIITYHFPPDAEIGGVRPCRIAEHLPALGIEPWVLTVSPEFAESPEPGLGHPGIPVGRVLRTRVKKTARDLALSILRFLKSWRPAGDGAADPSDGATRPGETERLPLAELALRVLSYPDPRRGWYRPAARAGDALLRQIPFDAIISTSPPRTAHRIAAQLARRHGLPWVMDFRDPWYTATAHGGIEPLLQRRLLRRTASWATALVANTAPMLRDLRTALPAVPLAEAIPNGFDSPRPVSVGRPDVFTIGYFGQMPKGRSAAAFFQGLREWLDRNDGPRRPVRVQFTGPDFAREVTLVQQLGLTSVVFFSPSVAKKRAIEEMGRQWLLLLVANDQPLQIPGKAYEYLASGRRILAVTERSSATAELLAGLEGCQTADSSQSVAAALETAWQDFEQGAPGVVNRVELLQQGAYRRRAEAFARLVRAAALHRGSQGPRSR